MFTIEKSRIPAHLLKYFELKEKKTIIRYGYISHLMQIFAEVKRVLKPTGTCWVNIMDSYAGAGGMGSDVDGKEKRGMEVIKQYNRQHVKGVPNKSLVGIPERFALAMTDGGWVRRNTVIWHKRNCLCGSTILYASTQRGVMPSTIKDLVRLKPETVQLWDGEKWQRVKEWLKNPSPQDIKEITFRNGEIIKCTGEHLFPLDTGEIKKASELNIGDVVKQIHLPTEEKIVKYIPDEIGWLLGTYLADGSIGDKGRCLQFSSNKKEQDRLLKLKNIAEKYDANCYSFSKQGNSATFNIYSRILIGIIKTYVGGDSAKNKHLTNAVWQRHNNFLESLLMGYLSGDGYYEKNNNRYRLSFCRNKDLARDLRLLCARLGYSIKLQKGEVLLQGKKFKKYSGEVRLERQKHGNNKCDSEIRRIKKGKNYGNFWDIVLEKEPHLFTSHSGILLHNCMPSSASDRFTVDFEYVFFFTKQGKYFFEQQFEPLALATLPRMSRAVSENNKWIKGADGQTPHNLSQPRLNVRKMHGTNYGGDGKGLHNHSGYFDYDGTPRFNPQGRNMRTVWDIPTQAFKEGHFAVFPEALVKRMVQAGCPKEVCRKCGKGREKIIDNSERINTRPGEDVGNAKSGTEIDPNKELHKSDLSKYRQQIIYRDKGYTDCGCGAGFSGGICLDPFMGSGTVGVVAKKLGRQWIGIELQPAYIKMAERRLENTGYQLKMLDI